MYAIIEDSGRQYRVSEGDLLRIDLLEPEAAKATIEFTRVLLVSDGDNVKVGTPLVNGAKVVAEMEKPQVKGKKIRVFKYKRRKGTRRTIGHRQKYTEVRITKIVA